MAISGGYAGQLFGLLVGFGLSQLKQTLMKGSQPFSLFDWSKINENLLDIMVIGTALIILVLTFLWGVTNKFHMSKPFAWIILALYSSFFVGATVIAVIKAAQTY